MSAWWSTASYMLGLASSGALWVAKELWAPDFLDRKKQERAERLQIASEQRAHEREDIPVRQRISAALLSEVDALRRALIGGAFSIEEWQHWHDGLKALAEADAGARALGTLYPSFVEALRYDQKSINIQIRYEREWTPPEGNSGQDRYEKGQHDARTDKNLATVILRFVPLMSALGVPESKSFAHIAQQEITVAIRSSHKCRRSREQPKRGARLEPAKTESIRSTVCLRPVTKRGTYPVIPPSMHQEAISFAVDYIAGKALDVGLGYVAHAARPTLTRLLGQRFGNGTELIPGPDLVTAKERLRTFLNDLDGRVKELERENVLSPERLDRLFTLPEVTAALTGAFTSAMETDDDTLVRQTLADLVVARLRAEDGSVVALAARIAAERMRDVTAQQTRLLAYLVLLKVDPMTGFYRSDGRYDENLLAAKRQEYVDWLTRYADRLAGAPADFGDFTHLRGLGLVDFTTMEHTAYDSGFTPPPLNGAAMLFPDLWNEPQVSEILRRLQDTADNRAASDSGLPMMAACTLTPAGWLIGAEALREITSLTLT